MSDGRMLFERERQDMARIVRVIFERKNTNVAGGNFSFKTTDDQGKDYIIMTPTMMSEAYLGEISPAQVLVVEPRTRRIVDGVGDLTREIMKRCTRLIHLSKLSCMLMRLMQCSGRPLVCLCLI